MGTAYWDAALWPDATVRSMYRHDWTSIDQTVLDQATPLIRPEEWDGPLELEIDAGGMPLPWASWRRAGYMAVLSLSSSGGAPLTYSLLIGRAGVDGEQPLLDRMATMHPGRQMWAEKPDPDARPLAEATARPLIATHIMTLDPSMAQLVHVCADIETIYAGAFFRHLRVGAD